MFETTNVAMAVHYFARLLNFFILVRVIFSWLRINPYSMMGQLIYGVTEPILGPIRTMIHQVFRYQGMIDFSPIVGIIFINAIANFAISLLR
ncbi:YggT family protein [Anoxynatronum buryatiense]|uniref:YggT family protein n=1 Tax=Anoxynatronum buryatiense TaxID=489973 RepID=A0AA46AI61_9CLOT|nr:YggT family protein [Anoxynatronum buryatiense]SMP46771.1 YggT family protein [Anoxynatronum buryatiense]